jgi:peptidoglycan/xylan/chitin deacetylase (PgdA/CDA1 family)
MYHWGSVIKSAAAESDSARLDLPPPLGARLKLPDAIGSRFAIFADAEEEFDWRGPFRREATSTEAIDVLPDANQFFVRAGCVPTYLADWPVVANPDSAGIMRAMVTEGACDIGTQLHPWVNPPFDEDVTIHNSYAGNLPRSLEAAKLKALTEKIEAATGVRPTVYRAGRYGIGANTAELLMTEGYRLDVSVRASFNYSGQGGPDFTHHPIWPWKVIDRLYEVPLTATYTGLLRHKLHVNDFGPTRGFLARTGLFDRVPLTPEGVRLHDALIAIRQLLDSGHQLFSLSFHTPTLVPGHTPYVRTASDLKKFWAWWDGVFNLFDKRGVLPIRSGAIVAALEAA